MRNSKKGTGKSTRPRPAPLEARAAHEIKKGNPDSRLLTGPVSNGVKCPRAVIFDLDNTLTESFQPPTPDVANRLYKLLELIPVAVMSGASFDRMEQYLLPSFGEHVDKTRLYLFTDTASQCFTWKDGAWQNLYKFSFKKEEYGTIIRAIKEGLEQTGITKGDVIYGNQFLARDTQITLAAIGIDAPIEMKEAWDPDGAKRKKMKKFLDAKLPGFNVLLGGRTAIDITRTGIDKAHGVLWFAQHLKTTPGKLIFVGDAFYPGGNDAIVIPTGIETIPVAGHREVAKVIDKILTACNPKSK